MTSLVQMAGYAVFGAVLMLFNKAVLFALPDGVTLELWTTTCICMPILFFWWLVFANARDGWPMITIGLIGLSMFLIVLRALQTSDVWNAQLDRIRDLPDLLTLVLMESAALAAVQLIAYFLLSKSRPSL